MKNTKTRVPETISEGLNIEENWEKQTKKEVVNLIDNQDKLSDVLEILGVSIKTESFGDDVASNLSMYEKKLIFAGFIASEALTTMKLNVAKQSFLQKMLGLKFGNKDNSDEEDV